MFSKTKKEFVQAFPLIKSKMTGYQDRFVAFVTHLGFNEAYRGNVAARNARFMAWISERRAQFVKVHPELVQRTYPTKYATITDQDAFTNFIISGAWLDSTKS